jgi:precorrin-6B methylase 2
MLERFRVLAETRISPTDRILDVGAGPHAITTVPLAHLVDGTGIVIAAERERWSHFREVTRACGVASRVRPVTCDARALPVRTDTFDLAVCAHAVRSLGDDDGLVRVIGEMLRVAKRALIAESLPDSHTGAQRAHLAMYNLRSEVFEALSGRPDDWPYRPMSRLQALVERAGGTVRQSSVIEVDLPHALAYFPRSYVERVPDPHRRADLLRRWDDANRLAEIHGSDHPPVGVLVASR